MKLTQSELDALLRRNKGVSLEKPLTFKDVSDLSKRMVEEIESKGLISQPEAKEVGSGIEFICHSPINESGSKWDGSSISFTIWGQPVGKPRQTRSDKWKKRPCVMRYRTWADKARASVPKGADLRAIREISFVAYLEIPKSYSKKKRNVLRGTPHFIKPDCDNVLKCFDALFPEDKMIWKVSGEKRWDDGLGPRIQVILK